MHPAAPLKFYSFDSSSFLSAYFENICKRLTYLRSYLNDLGANSVIEEPYYFDRDYLSEFSAFYGASARGYSNVCRRVHVFKQKIQRDTFLRAISGGKQALKKIQTNYLGFIVIRPVPESRFGRTVLAWYDDPNPSNPRVTNPSRFYECHLAGIPLKIRGLAWQQQDTGVAACATVAVWTLLHSSAFDDYHSIPTTAEITMDAHRKASMGKRVFPSSGLTIEELCESIKEQGLSPIVLSGDLPVVGHSVLQDGATAFSPERFASSCSAFIRSGYPVLIYGELVVDGRQENAPHATVAVGFRPTAAATIPTKGDVRLQDGDAGYFYLHDDNLGPSVRFKLETDPICEPVQESGGGAQSGVSYAKLTPEAPAQSSSPTDLFSNYGPFYPGILVAAVHQDLRSVPDVLHQWGMSFADDLYNIIKQEKVSLVPSLRVRIIKQHKLLEDEFGFLSGKPKVLSRVKMGLMEKLPPMSLHIAQIRVAFGVFPLIDVLFDTSDSQENIFGHVVYHKYGSHLVERSGLNLGPAIVGYDE